MFWRLCKQQLKTVCQQSLVKVPEFQTTKRHRRYNECRKMSDYLQPPSEVRGMLKLERDRFKKTIRVPVLRLDAEAAHKLMPKVSKFYLKMKCLPPVRHPEGDSKHFELLLHPKLVTTFESLPIEELSNYNVTAENLSFQDLELNYANWRADEILGAVLPPADAVGSYSFVGHIVHVNIRDHLTQYKHLIGEVLLDKVARCRTVVNKSAIIENTFRNFQLELLAGEPDYQVSAKENGCHFEFDYSLVYWNPRLSTEHQRIRDLLNPGDILYDCFAGVGPFSVPAAQKLCIVKANDLNPESVRWLKYNLKRNKCKGHYEVFNKDGRQFILEDIREDLCARWQFIRDRRPIYDIHITMNLPAIAIEFLDAFRGLLMNEPEAENLRWEHLNYPLVHVYCFFKGDSEETTMQMAMAAVDEHVGMVVKNKRVHYVRNVAPNKDMYRVTFPLSREILMTAKEETTKATQTAKEPKTEAGSTQPEVKMTEETPKSASIAPASASEATEKPTQAASSTEEEPQPAKRSTDEAEQPPAKLQKQST